MLDTLNERYIEKLSEGDMQPANFVLGEGKSSSPVIMMIGEAPGEHEVLQGRPFVGKAGKNLDAFLDVVGLSRDDIYITNAVKIRPTKTSLKGRLSNRPPTRLEQARFAPWLLEELDLVAPKIVVTLGNTPLRALLGQGVVIGDYHGRLTETMLCNKLFALYHPAAVIYNRSLMDTYQKDLLMLKALVSEVA